MEGVKAVVAVLSNQPKQTLSGAFAVRHAIDEWNMHQQTSRILATRDTTATVISSAQPSDSNVSRKARACYNPRKLLNANREMRGFTYFSMMFLCPYSNVLAKTTSIKFRCSKTFRFRSGILVVCFPSSACCKEVESAFQLSRRALTMFQ